jgi:hypothetical protein
VHGALFAVVHPDNTPHGANLTFAVPVLVFVITSAALFLRFRAAHTAPGHVPIASSRWVTAGKGGMAAFGQDPVDAAVESPEEPEATAIADAPAGASSGPGTVQSGATGPGTDDPAGTASEQGKRPSEGTEDGE